MKEKIFNTIQIGDKSNRVSNEAQPEVFRNAFSGIWWSMSTLLTVGYGDIYPITPLGRVMAIR